MDEEPFEIVLADSNEESAHFRLQNEPGERQREFITGYDRKGALRVLGRLADVVHGRSSSSLSEGSDDDDDDDEDDDGDNEGVPCSLAIFEFAALGQKSSRRYREVQIDIVFAAHGREDATARRDPYVRDLAPQGSKRLLRTTRRSERRHGFEAGAQVGADPLGSASASYTYAVSDVVERGDSMAVEGGAAFVGRAMGKPNAARFAMRENGAQRSGVPRYLRVAVLLERRAGDEEGLFVATVDVRARVSVFADAGERVRRVMGRIPLDDAVVFDPKMPPTTDKYPVNNLASVSLSGECAVESGYAEGDETEVGEGF
ncbi:hypothetical protein F4811DRAFT_31885 [Daldinia bambusicola]|nr:hypothetical protein F4811DRAFT_31885 [Daldinia bambusicola]